MVVEGLAVEVEVQLALFGKQEIRVCPGSLIRPLAAAHRELHIMFSVSLYNMQCSVFRSHMPPWKANSDEVAD